jgi:hypothetical protein
MTIENVKHDTIAPGVGYAVGLLGLLLWPNREEAHQDLVYFSGMVILLVVYGAIEIVAFKWRPTLPSFDLLAYVTQTRPRTPRSSRPLRYSIPRSLGLVAAVTFPNLLRSAGAPDWGLTAFAVGVPVLLGGNAASNLWWALASRSGSGNVPRAHDGAAGDQNLAMTTWSTDITTEHEPPHAGRRARLRGALAGVVPMFAIAAVFSGSVSGGPSRPEA